VATLAEPPDRYVKFPAGWAGDPSLTANEVRVLLALLLHRNRKTGRCDPSQTTLTKDTGLSDRSIRRALVALRRRGLVSWERIGQRERNAYVVHDRPGAPVTDDPQPASVAGQTGAGGRSGPALVAAELEEVNQMNEPEPPALPGMPLPPLPEPNAGHLVAAWCENWSAAHHGRQPDPSVVKRVAGGCRQVAKTRTSRESWVTAWQAAGDAGRRGLMDVVTYLADYRPPARAATGANAAMQVARELAVEQARWPPPNPPTLGPFPPDQEAR